MRDCSFCSYQCLDIRIPSTLDKHIIAPARQERIYKLRSGSSEGGKFTEYTDEESLRVAEERFEEDIGKHFTNFREDYFTNLIPKVFSILSIKV